MDKQLLSARLTGSAGDNVRVPQQRALGDDPLVPLPVLLDLCYDETHRMLAFRAAWLLEYIAVHHHDRFLAVAGAFLTRLHMQKNTSCQRHFTGILRMLSHHGAPAPYRQAMAGANRELLVETVFNWLIDPETPVAVQANCMDVLLNMSAEFDWIRDELKLQIEFLLRDGTPAIQSRGKRILEKLVRVKSGD